MLKQSSNSKFETGNGCMLIRSPEPLLSSWLFFFVPIFTCFLIGFFNHDAWRILLPFSALVGFHALLTRYFYPKYETLIDFQKREITWSGAKIRAWLFEEPNRCRERVLFSEILYVRSNEYENDWRYQRQSSLYIALRLKNSENVLLARFDSLLLFKKTLAALEDALQNDRK